MSQWARKSTSLAALVLGMLALVSADAFASHFRYGTIRWQANDPTQPHVITFTVESAWRRSYFGSPGVGAVINLGVPFVFGDGSSATMTPTVTAMNPTEDWVAGIWTYTRTYPATARTYNVSFSSCCRISSLQEGNADASFTVTSTVTVNPRSEERR